MSEWPPLLLIATGAVFLVGLGWWLLIETEGVYLGRRMVIWLYDLYAGRYDDIKGFRSDYDHLFLAQPIMDRIAPVRSPMVLDVAAGTGRLSLALLNHAHFQGRVVAIDLSRRMLAEAAAKIADDRVSLLWCPAEALPFCDDTFDVVTCLEALEFMTQPSRALAEIARVLRPGGLLLMTNRIGTRWMPGKTMSGVVLVEKLHSFGIEKVEIDYWQVDYDRVWGCKAGSSSPRLARPLSEILLCPRCGHSGFHPETGSWRCAHCSMAIAVGNDGVLELARWVR
ncbi:MAG: class I SAM-dependent methyltransferase [Aggregatilineales bacterium]